MRFCRLHTKPHKGENVTHTESHEPVKAGAGQKPTATETAALLGVPVDEVQEVQGYMQPVVSLYTPIAEYNSLTLAGTLQADVSLENDAVNKIL